MAVSQFPWYSLVHLCTGDPSHTMAWCQREGLDFLGLILCWVFLQGT